MSLSSNTLRVQVDTPIWEWCRVAPLSSTAISASCSPDNSNFNVTNGRYIYYYIATGAGGFWRYDTWSDTYLALSIPQNIAVTRTSMRFSGALGYNGRVISAANSTTSNVGTLTTGLPFGGTAKGYKIRIISGTGAGQERYITGVSDPIVADYGVATNGAVLGAAGSPATLIDSTKTWSSGYSAANALNVNNWVGYTVRTTFGTGLLQTRKILYNSTTTLYIGDVRKHTEEPWCHATWTAPAAGTQYQIESSVLTLDSAWNIIPDNTSRYVIQSGGIYMLSGAAATPFLTMQYYDVLADVWYVKPVLSAVVQAATTDLTMEKTTENASIWDLGTPSAVGTTTTLTDNTNNWTVNQWAGYNMYICSGTGMNQIIPITSNTNNTLTFPALAQTTATCSTGASGDCVINSASAFPVNCNGWYITGTNVGTGAFITGGQGTTSITVSVVNSGSVNGQTLTLSPLPNISCNSGALGAFTIGSATTFPNDCNGWTVAGTGVATGATVVGGQGTTTLTLSAANTASVSGNTVTFSFIPDLTSHYQIMGFDAGTVALNPQATYSATCSTGASTTFVINSSSNFPSVCNGYSIAGTNVGSGAVILSGQGTTTLTVSVANTGSVNGQTLTISPRAFANSVTQVCSTGANATYVLTSATAFPVNCNGMYVTGTNVGGGAYVMSGQGTTTLTVSVANTGSVNGNTLTLTLIAPIYNSLADTTKSWTVNRWANYAVRIMSGTGAGQLRSISGNTATTLLLYNNWSITPDATSVYVIQGDSNNQYIATGSAATTATGEVLIYRAGDIDTLSHGRVLDSGVANQLCAMLCDANHVIAEQPAISLSGISRSGTVATATIANSNTHNLQAGQYVSIRGSTTAGDVQYYCGLQQITGVPGTGAAPTTFTFTVSASASAAATILSAQSTSLVVDASKDHRAVATGGSSGGFTVSFGANTPTNINGWYAYGTGIGAGAQVVSGTGTTTLILSVANTGSLSGNTIQFNAWGPGTALTMSSTSGASGTAVLVMSGTLPQYCVGWSVTGTNIGVGAKVGLINGTTVVLTKKNTGAVGSTTITLSPPLGENMVYGNSTDVTVTTGASTVGQAMQISSSGLTSPGNSLTLFSTFANALTSGASRYVIAKREPIGAAVDGTTTTYYSGTATSGAAAGTFVDANAFYTTGAECTVTAQSTTITLATTATPTNINGWYLVAGTGVNVGSQVIAGAGTTTLTMSMPQNATNSALTLTFCAWNTSGPVNKRIKLLGQSLVSEGGVTVYAAATGTFTFTNAGGTPVNGTTSYSIISSSVRSTGIELNWLYGLTDTSKRGKYLIIPRGGALSGFDRLDLTTDRWILMQTTPVGETLNTGSDFAYDGINRLYFTKDATQRLYYLDLLTNWIHGAGLYPYAPPTTAYIGNRMEIFQTVDGLNYLWINRSSNAECFKQLLFY